MKALVTDTSAWIAYFSGEECPLLEAGLVAGNLFVPSMVITELLGNNLAPKERRALEEALRPFPIHGTDSEHYYEAGHLKCRLESLGISVSARDAHILQCALDLGAILVSKDPLFLEIQQSSGVRVQM